MRGLKVIVSALLVTAAGGLFGPAAADQPGPDWMTAAEVRKGLLASGYSEITKLEADDGHWDGAGVKDGRRMTFDADARTGAILGEAPE